jgi:hypothetical protein
VVRNNSLVGLSAKIIHYYFNKLNTNFKMQELNFPKYDFTITRDAKGDYIYDIIRKKNVKLTPEEWVRQHLVHYFIFNCNYPQSLIGVEKQIKVGNMLKRFDVVVFNRNAKALLLAECKAPDIEITEDTFDQAARYNLALSADYFVITNGIDTFSCKIDYDYKKYSFLSEFPNLFSKK